MNLTGGQGLNSRTNKKEARMTADRLQIVRDCYGAYESGDRSAIEPHLSEDFTFYSPYDVGIDRARYFERCWPNADQLEAFDYVRLVEVGDEVLVTYESRKTDGSRFRNTEIHTFEGDKICRVEVYFGWDL
jgi:ketosteroid isomerase-like protein